jgi:hypothetical protein
MRRTQRIVLLAAFVLAAPVLSGCSSFDPENLDIFGLTEKKKLPGDRKPVFPEGVPGVVQGVPPQYIKGNQPTADADAALNPAPVAPVEQAKPAVAPEPAAKPKPKRKVAAKPKPAAAAPVQPVTQEPQPQQAQAPQGATPPASGAAAPWPAPPPAGTFSR